MSGTSALMALAARCEAAKGPDQELDAAIEKQLPCSHEFALHHRGKAMSQWNENAFRFYNIGDEGREYRSPPYTASLDAAMTLVPEGHGWLGTDTHIEHWAQIVQEGHLHDGAKLVSGCSTAKASSLALALCAAALRARGDEV